MSSRTLIRCFVFLSVEMALPVFGLLSTEQPGYDSSLDRTRHSTLLNSDWRFEPDGTLDGQDLNLDASTWQSVALPHTWNTEDPFDEIPGYCRGTSWYRRKLDTPNDLGKRHLYLRLEGMNQRAEVYVDGQLATRHVGGYTAFVCDITKHLNPTPGANNLIAVRVDNSWDADVPPLAKINFAIYGGIYRNVHLLAVAPVHIAIDDFSSPGVYIDTPLATHVEARVRVRGVVENHDDASHDCTVINTLLSPEGQEVGTSRTELALRESGRSEFETIIDLQETLQLWSPDNAVLYRVKTAIQVEGKVRDVVSNTFGIRWFHFDPEQGFFLNGEHLYLKGTNRHQDREGFGNALTDPQHREDLALIKQMGANFLRLGHYPQAPAVLERGHRIWAEEHKTSKRGFPGLTYILLHSFSHLMVTAVSLECGYPASSIRERIYAIPDVGYGVLLFTATSDAEGTLGGLGSDWPSRSRACSQCPRAGNIVFQRSRVCPT